MNPPDPTPWPRSVSILGAGWLGLPLGEALVERGCRVRGSSTRAERLPLLEAAGLEAHRVEVGERLVGERLDDFFGSEVLILNIPPGRGQPQVETHHPRQVAAVLDRAAAGGVRHLLFVSSTSVYGNRQSVVTEADPTEPERASGRALVRAEALLRERLGRQATVLRLAGLVGGDRHPGRWLAGKQDLPNGDAPVNLVHREDCIGVILAILEQGAWGETFNLSADLHPTRRQLYTALARKKGLPPPTFIEGDKPRYKIIANAKVKAELGYALRHPDPSAF